MLAWMIYATLAGALFVTAAAVLEKYPLFLARRFLWLGAVAGTLSVIVAAAMPAATKRDQFVPISRARAPLPSLVAGMPLPAQALTRAVRAPRSSSSWSAAQLDAPLMLAWLLASAVCLCGLGASVWRIAQMRRGWREAIVAGVPVLVSHDVGPAVVGLIHQGIVVPRWLESLDDDAKRTVLAHEREHVRAGDPLLLWGATFLVALAPWNAPLWYALRRLRHAIEMDCDARVLRVRPDAHAYCALLLDVGERTLAGVAPIAALAEPSTLLERRINAMVAPASVSRRTMTAGALASLMLVAAAFVAPRPQATPVAHLSAMVARGGPIRIHQPVESAERDTAYIAGLDSGLSPQRDVVLRTLYPQLRGRADTSALLVVLTYDAQRRLRGSYVSEMPSGPWYGAADFSSVQIQVFGMRKYAGLHTTVVPVVEKWDITAEPVPSAYGGRAGPAESSNVPPSRQFARRVDSLAHVNVPQAFTPKGDAQFVTVLFDAAGNVVRWFRSPRTSGESIDATIVSHGPAELLAHVLPTPVPALAGYGAYTFHDAPQTIFLFAELASPRVQRPATESRAIVMLKPIAKKSSDDNGTTSVPAEDRTRNVLVYTTGDAAMAIGGEVPTARRDTLHVRLPGNVSLDLSKLGDVHFMSADGVPFEMSGMLVGKDAAQQLGARGKHMMIMSGGWGIRGIE